MSIKQYDLDRCEQTKEEAEVFEPLQKEDISEPKIQKVKVYTIPKEKKRNRTKLRLPLRAFAISFTIVFLSVFFVHYDFAQNAKTFGNVVSFVLHSEDKSAKALLDIFTKKEDVQLKLDEFMSKVPNDVQNTQSVIEESNTTPNDETATEVFENVLQTDTRLSQSDLSRGGDKLYLNNETSYNVDLATLLSKPLPQELLYSGSAPSVLIVHTHGSECYSESKEYPTSLTRTTDKSKNVVRVGAELKKVLEQYGIATLHCEELHDDVSFLSAYKNSKKTIDSYLKQYPTIQYVIDVHRDSIVKAEAEVIKTMSAIETNDHAQLMLVVGTNENGADHPFWQDNLRFAAEIQNTANTYYPTLMRPVNLRKSSFNHQVSKGAFILEVGSFGNTLEEAINAVKLFGKTFARTLAQNKEE